MNNLNNDIDEKTLKKLQFYYDENGKVKQYPTKRNLRDIILQEIIADIDKDKKYSEKEINQIIKEHISFSDYEFLRRELIDFQLLERTKDGSQYWLKQS